MKHVVLNLIWLLAAIGVFILVSAMLSETLEKPAWMPFDFHDGPWLHALLKLFGVVTLMPPFTAVLAALFALGSSPSRWALWSDQHADNWVLLLSPGMKWSMVGLALILAGGIVFALWVQNEPLGVWLFASPLFVFSFYVGLVFLLIKVKFDQTQITAMTMLLQWKTHKWADLERIEFVPSWTELRLHFKGNKMARVSIFLQGSVDFVEFAKAKLAENHEA